FALARDASGQLADQAGDGGRLFSFRLAAEEFVETIHIHSSGNNERSLAFAHNLRLLVVVANFAHNLFHQILDGDQTGYAAIFVHDDRHADILLLHFAQQVAAQLTFRDEVNVAPHDRFQDAHVSFAVGH